MNNFTFECQNCGKNFAEGQLEPIRDIMQRIDPGEQFPAGECPECGALCHQTLTSQSVWFDFGAGPVKHEEKTPSEMNAFVAGVSFACEHLRIEDYRQFDTEEEAAQSEATP